MAGLPYRGPGRDRTRRPTGIPLPPGSMPSLRRWRPLKRWRYVAVFADEVMLCAGDVRIGPGRQTFWAIWDRRARRLLERTAWLRHGRVRLDEGRLRVADDGVLADLLLEEEDGIEAVCPNGPAYVWTRKQAGIAARGRVLIDGRETAVDARAVIDDTAGYHSRHTAWRWSAGVGETGSGERVAWNLVEGVNDPPSGSERALWVEGVASEPGPVSFDPELRWLRFSGGEELAFEAEARRARSDNLVIVSSDYEAPFGTFTGHLPGGRTLARGLGVMERHCARW